MIEPLRNRVDMWRAMRVRHMSRYWQATADVPAALYPYWQRSAQFDLTAFHGMPFFSPAPLRAC